MQYVVAARLEEEEEGASGWGPRVRERERRSEGEGATAGPIRPVRLGFRFSFFSFLYIQ
jgi:hypothetical protein